MGVLENYKTQLLKRSAQKREALETELGLLSEKTEKVLMNALVIGGSLAVSYFLMRQFMKSKTKKKARKQRAIASDEDYAYVEPQQPSFVSSLAGEVGTALASHLTAFLLQLAKEKLVDYLNTPGRPKANEDNNGDS